MNKFFCGVLVTLLVVYVISPIDLVPGPVDDALAIFLFVVANKERFLGTKKVSEERPEIIDVEATEVVEDEYYE